VPQIEVTFDIDANGILNVSAKDKATGKSQAITITASSGLEKSEVEKMVQDAAAHAEEDKKKRDLIDQRNQADSMAYSLEKTLNENKDKVDESEARAIEEAIAEVRKAAEGEDVEAIKNAMEKLTKHSHKLAEELYKQQAPEGTAAGGPMPGADPGAAAPPPPGGNGHDAGDVVDAEYTVKD
jgi:molecular chaperone DnaK